jgi:hypothetical protein
MADMTNYLEEEILNHIFRRSAIFGTPTTVFVALHTGDPGEAGTANEISGGAYARQGVDTGSGTNWTDPATGTQGESDNNADITFPQATAAWGTISHVSIWGTASAGDTSDVWLKGSLTTDKAVASGDTFKFASGDLNVQMA